MKNFIPVMCCAIGGILVGFFANKLSTPSGIVMFVIGVLVLSLSGYNASK